MHIRKQFKAIIIRRHAEGYGEPLRDAVGQQGAEEFVYHSAFKGVEKEVKPLASLQGLNQKRLGIGHQGKLLLQVQNWQNLPHFLRAHNSLVVGFEDFLNLLGKFGRKGHAGTHPTDHLIGFLRGHLHHGIQAFHIEQFQISSRKIKAVTYL